MRNGGIGGAWRRQAMAAILAIASAAALPAAPAAAQVNCAHGAYRPVAVDPGAANPGSRRNPWLNRRHVVCGEINSAGNAVGWHYREGGLDPVYSAGPPPQLQARIAGSTDPALPGGGAIYQGRDIQI